MKIKGVSKVLSIVMVVMMMGIFELNAGWVEAKTTQTYINGYVCEFGEKDDYDLSAISNDLQTYGTLKVGGEIYKTSTEDDITTISVKRDYTDESTDYNLSFSYLYDDQLLNASDDEWHLVESGDKKIGNISLGEKMKNGALILQVSIDQKNWVTTFSQTNIFEDSAKGLEDFYTTTQVQLVNGCYYRVLVAYETSKLSDASKILLWNKKSYDSKKNLEIYNFYVSDQEAEKVVTTEKDKKYSLGSKVRCDKFEGYYGSKTITNKDPHYGWDLGEFFVSGYTDAVKDSDGNIVFLKNTGDQVGLWFNLEQDINALNGNDAITIEADDAGSDQYFETPSIDFGKGTLIIRKTNYENVQGAAQIYTDYLEANTSVGANTKVDLFEEGDYEVALDYAIKYDKTKILGASVLPEEAHYRIYFKFSVRNANSMFYPRDVETTSELANNAITPNGFYLDLANSKYLQLSIVREVLKDGAMGLTEDVRFNNVAKDGDKYTEEGIYTVTVTNQYTGKSTTKKLYVGDDNVLKAYMTTGLSISEIQDKIAQGATIDNDGNIVEPVNADIIENNLVEEEVTETISNDVVGYTVVEEEQEATSESHTEDADNAVDNNLPVGVIVCVVIIIAGVVFGVYRKKKTEKKSGGKE